MRRSLLIGLLALIPLTASSNATLAQTTCADRCQGQSACLKRCAEVAKRRSQLKQQYLAPRPSNSANERIDEWRERAFRIDGGNGGNGGSM